MENVNIEVKKNKLTITIDLSEEIGVSSSGKSMVIATTSGNVEIPEAKIPGLRLGLNLYKPVENGKKSKK